MPDTLTELVERYDAKAAELDRIFAEAGDAGEGRLDFAKITSLTGDSQAKAEAIRALDAELSDLTAQIKPLNDAKAIAERRRLDREAKFDRPALFRGDDEPTKAPRAKTIGQAFVESEAYSGRPIGASMSVGPLATLDVNVAEYGAAVFQRTAGWAAESLRTGNVVPIATRPIQVTDLFSTGETTMAAVVYMEETTFTNAAAERAEAAVYAESAFALTQRTENVQTIGTSVPVTDEQLADVAQAASYLDARVQFAVRQRLDSQLLNGDAVAPNIRGLLNASGLQTQAKGADPTPDAIYKAMQKVRITGRAFPSALCIHPDDWTDIRLLRTADGIYIWGMPSDPRPDSIWGLVVAQTDALTVNTALLGDFSPMMVQLFVRAGLDVQVGFVNDDFQKGKRTIRAGIRVANVIYRGAAFCTVTGI